MADLRIRLLGGFEVTRDGEPVAGFVSDKAQALLAFLAVEADRPHRRESLAGLLEPDVPERAARTSQRTALANVRQVIGDSEGFHNAEDQTDGTVTVDRKPPTVSMSGLEGASVPEGSPATLSALALDREDGSVAPGQIAWSSSLGRAQ